MNDLELLQEYHREGSEAAFAELVRRHLNLVYSAALRHVGISAHAEEIAQAVFIILARKAAGLRPDTVLAAWLHETTRLTARLQAATSSNRPILLRTTATAGHGMGSSLRDRVAEQADIYAFLFEELGVDTVPWTFQ